MALEDLTGMRFGKLVVLGYDHSEKKQRYWKCQCDCGKNSIVSTGSLKSGNSTTCGCGKVQQIIDLTGKRFGKLVVLRMAPHVVGDDVRWECVCDCGNEITVSGHSLKRGQTRSCGCYHSEVASRICKERERVITVNKQKYPRIYGVWSKMHSRCENPNNKSYRTYGAAGITVCDEWRDFNNFREWAYANGYDEDAPHFACTLDRIDNTKGYSPDNCRWVDMKAQSRNTSRNIRIAYNGVMMVATDLAKALGIDDNYLIERIRAGLTIDEIVALPKHARFRKTSFRPVTCVETGQKFPSINAAAQCISRHPSTLSVALKNQKRTCAGYHWSYTNK